MNTIQPHEQPAHPDDRVLEHKIRSIIRWNAAAIVLRANKTSSELGGHIASFQSAATLYDPRLMRFWQFPSVSMGLGPLMAIYQARFLKYLDCRGLADTKPCKVRASMGNGEMDEPESLGAISLAGRECLDNLVFVIN